MRHVSDVDGIEWEVFAVEKITSRPEAVRESLSDGWLCFQRKDGHRIRVPRANIPGNWEKLESGDLLALMANGLPAIPKAHS